MNRVLVIGCGGSGKTVLARRIADLFDLEAVSLDRHYYFYAAWNPAPPDEFATQLRQMVAADAAWSGWPGRARPVPAGTSPMTTSTAASVARPTLYTCMSREKLANLAEVSTVLIKSIERGQRSLTLRTAQRIAPTASEGSVRQPPPRDPPRRGSFGAAAR